MPVVCISYSCSFSRQPSAIEMPYMIDECSVIIMDLVYNFVKFFSCFFFLSLG